MKANFKQIESTLAQRGITIRRITKDNPHGGYTTGYLLERNGADWRTELASARWASLANIQLNVCELGRDIDGFARR